ncbi:MAG: YbdK family carboxylate-amine ligase [Thermoleophilaceae bacterium]|nr:YbdK family carboxylate-amine ligase [Thermoleophilaceae bacterium]
MTKAREVFEASEDFTVGIEEEFGIVDPESLELVHRYEELKDAAQADEVLRDAMAGELISSEIEIRSGRGADFADAVTSQGEARARLFKLAGAHDLGLMATGTHPWATWQDQRIIDTDHYRRVSEGLGYVAWRNNTFGLHVHVGVNGPDRAIAVCDRMRVILPELLAISANSPFLDARDSGLHSARTQIFTKSFPRCGIPEAFGSWDAYAEYVECLVKVNSIVEQTQLWWSIRPHHAFGTVEVRICDAQSSGDESTALAGLITACVAQSALDWDDGALPEPPAGRLIEENFWRAIRFGLEGKLIDLERGEEFPAASLHDRLLAWTGPARAAMGGFEPSFPERNGAQRQRGRDLVEAFRDEYHLTRRTYAPEEVTT